MNRFSAIIFILCISFAGTSALGRPTFGRHGLVVSDSDLSSQAGVQTLQAGGNAADAAVTTAFMLAVTRPYYASLGGGGFMVMRFNNAVLALNHRERAPFRSSSGMYLQIPKPHASTIGALAVATPGTVLGYSNYTSALPNVPGTLTLNRPCSLQRRVLWSAKNSPG